MVKIQGWCPLCFRLLNLFLLSFNFSKIRYEFHCIHAKHFNLLNGLLKCTVLVLQDSFFYFQIKTFNVLKAIFDDYHIRSFAP